MSVTQKEVVFLAIKSVLDQFGSTYRSNGKVVLGKNDRKIVISTIISSIESGTMSFSDKAKSKYNTPKLVKIYANGLISNALLKDERLNGNVDYVPTNPGSRVGQNDPIIKDLRAIRSKFTEPDQIEAVNSEIENRRRELLAQRSKKSART